MANNYITTVGIAIICGLVAGVVGSPGFSLIVPLLFMLNVTDNLDVALGIYFIGSVLPHIINAITIGVHKEQLLNINIIILFSVVFAITSSTSIYFSDYLSDGYKFSIAGIMLFVAGIWYFQYGYSHTLK